MRDRLIIVGAGGLGRIVYDVLINDPEVGDRIELAGFLDTREDLRLPEDIRVPLLGNPLSYRPREGECFIPAVGDPRWRRDLMSPLLGQGARLFTYSGRASVAARSSVGGGTFLTPGVVISVDCEIGDCAYVDTGVIVGHDVRIGAHCMLGAMTFLAGGVRLGDGVAIHPRATIAKGVRVGDGATVGIGSVVLKDVPEGATVFGNPSRVIHCS